MKIFFWAVVAVCIYIYKQKLEKDDERWQEAVYLHSDMFDKYIELMDDPSMSYFKWKEWLPLFEEADRRCINLSPEAKKLGRVSDYVKQAIRDDGYEKDFEVVR